MAGGGERWGTVGEEVRRGGWECLKRVRLERE